ncbi:MAG TPA: DUF6922 domain-containing protein [Candidatus Wunengus californicus]|uniref:DUF6922 domain-containing protein n=1 Tax=Candidatus Wunengus californicus TaxID=3367619 RepID=UPI00402527EE
MLDLESDKFLIIERSLEHGGNKQIEFVLDYYSREDVIRAIQESPYLSLKTVNYWCLFFNLKREDTRCFRKHTGICGHPVK